MQERDGQAREETVVPIEKGRTSLCRLFLSRLERLSRLSQEPILAGWQRDLLKRAIYSTYLDCLALGIAAEARPCLPVISNQESRAIARI